VDHKSIAKRYIVTAFIFFVLAGLEAATMRAQLARPENTVLGPDAYNQFFTMHGLTMMFLFAVPIMEAMGLYFVPLMIGARNVAFPRLNALSYWLYLFGGITMLLGFATDGGAAGFGWFAYPPLSGPAGSPGLGADLWIVAIILTGTSGTLGAVNIITTISMLRAPGMTMFRMPILTWNLYLTSFMVLVAFPVLTGALIMLEAVRDWRETTGEQVGVKPAGGIRTSKDAIKFLVAVNEIAGEDWLDNHWFRFGASSLLNDLILQRQRMRTGAYSGGDYVADDSPSLY
jgi:cytochrome c oxidase subunit 1